MHRVGEHQPVPADVKIEAARRRLREALLSQRTSAGGWVGHLSSSALSTAVASVALAICGREAHASRWRPGVDWLLHNQNADGSWGDTPESPGNVATTTMSWAALRFLTSKGASIDRARVWLERELGSCDPEPLSRSLLDHYGRDRTFSVPILVLCALCGVLGERAWHHIPKLPAVMALLPPRLYRYAGFPVVSYALPALIAMGICVHAGRAGWRLKAGSRVNQALMRRLARMLPTSGGFLEAIPLTGFVCMALARSGFNAMPVVRACERFLKQRQRGDGSWAIDSNLSTWVTTLAVKALSHRADAWTPADRNEVAAGLLAQQFQYRHPFTGAKPGGWGWTPLPGSVPDADDTAGALIALFKLSPESRPEAAAGIRWLMNLQNRDGGIPTFCRGWGKLPFDRSCPDLTAHSIQAWAGWREAQPALRVRMDRAIRRAVRWLKRVQHVDGSWDPLWFGNQKAPGMQNPVYGTATVVRCLRDACNFGSLPPSDKVGCAALIESGADYLRGVQAESGAWGGAEGVAGTVEETALAISALSDKVSREDQALGRGLIWLCRQVEQQPLPSAPIGLYFARLWYDEQLYPLVFALDALERCGGGEARGCS